MPAIHHPIVSGDETCWGELQLHVEENKGFVTTKTMVQGSLIECCGLQP